MNPILAFLLILGAFALGLGLLIALVVWAAGRLDRTSNAASGFQRDVPYVEPAAPYTETSERDSSFLAGDFPQTDFDRLRAEIEQVRTEAADPTSPAHLRRIPAQRKEQP